MIKYSHKGVILDFTPIIPTDLQGIIDPELLVLCGEICIKSDALSGSHNPQVLDGIKELLHKLNKKTKVPDSNL